MVDQKENEEKDEMLRNDDVLNALAALREEQNDTTEQNFTVALLNAQLIAPVNFTEEPTVSEEGELEMPAGAEIKLITFQTEDDETVFPAFTDMDAFGAQPIESEEKVYPWVMTIEDYLPFVQGEEGEQAQIAGIALNPFTNGMPITRDNLAYLATLIKNYDNQEIQITAADEIAPTALKYELIGLADDHHEAIDHMYLLRLNGQEGSAYLLVVDGPDRTKIQELQPQFEQIFKANAGQEGAAFNLAMKEDLADQLTDFQTLYDRDIQ
ncbi:SseB family protein [Weissella halotolerans]|uniref:SseB protein N-terminal domain-containing protein n=1 Tax=Weissella halotolerans DSM 20190 TaxID=1123500 RepID=A0A0R2G1L3_9LACO|nr:SseB family protein [Weissella halotolerans]KRN31274.1 hypothetical protein IV68_GL001157 [Weissella halotolerans DSM 20190]